MTNKRAIWELIQTLPGPQLWILGKRIHHGLIGCWFIGIGCLLVTHDWRDRPWATH